MRPAGVTEMRSALVLAGGFSTRFGERDKATAQLDGEPLVCHVVDGVAPVVDEVVVSCREEQRDAIASALSDVDYRMAADPIADGGPVAGIRTGCRVANGDWTFVTACDMPFVRSDLVTTLFESAREDGAVPRIDDRQRPLAAVYRTDSVVEAADTTIRTGARDMRTLLDRLSVATVEEPAAPRTVEDIDTREELRAAREQSPR